MVATSWLRENGALGIEYTRALSTTTWDFWKEYGMTTGEFKRWWRMGVEQEYIYRKGNPIPGARDALWRLSDAEWSIDICTHRLNQFGNHHKITLNTVNWLHEQNIPYRNLLFLDEKTLMSADAIVDDMTKYMDPNSHGRCFLFPANHNAGKRVSQSMQIEYWNKVVEELT